MASLLPTFSTPIVRRLLTYKKTVDEEDDRDPGEEKWSEKAVKSLVKKLRKTGGLTELEKAITSEGRIHTDCVTIARSLDGRLQVSHRKGLPHVMYCRLWRWPDLQTHHELKAIDTCQYAFSSKKDEVCVNPYHYIRIESPTLPPVLVPNGYQHQQQGIPSLNMLSYEDTLPENRTLSDELGPSFGSRRETPPPPYAAEDINTFNIDSPGQSSYSGIGSPIMSPTSCGPASVNSVNSVSSTGSYMPPSFPSASGDSYYNINYIEPAYWASICYYELKTKVGEAFQASKNEITIDGFTNPIDSSRFCLGQLANVNRDHDRTIEQTRRHIGRGLKLIYVGGQVKAQCVGENPIFIQSANANLRNNWDAFTVTRVTPGDTIVVFDNYDFSQRLRESVFHGFESVYELARMCIIRISFIKGWGTEYRRPFVTTTPCWIEIHLNGSLQWVDKVLTEMGAPDGQIRSDT